MPIRRRQFLQQMTLSTAAIGLAQLIPTSALGEITKYSLPRGIPEAEGLSSSSILSFIESVEQKSLGLHSLMIIRHGKVVAEGWWDPYKPDLKHVLFSLSKSFTSTAIGFAVSEGKLTVEDKVISYFPEYLPETVSPNLAAMRVKDLLTMNTGHDKETMGTMRRGSQSWIKTFLSLPVEHKPGSFFLYNSGATYMLAAILQKLTGKTLLAYLKPRLFDRLDITGADWEISPEGIHTAAYGLRVTTEDIAKFGQLYLQKGIWKGKRIIPEKWVAEATSLQVDNASHKGKDENSDWQQGYGYQFWRCRHNLYRGDGAMGQYCIVMPEHDAVVVITSETANMQAIMDEVWTHILGGLKASSLPTNQQDFAALKEKLGSLTLLPAKSTDTSPVVSNISGKSFILDQNVLNASSVALTFAKDSCLFSLKDETGEHSVRCGLYQWIKTETIMPGAPPNLVWGPPKTPTKAKVAGTGVWKNPNTFEITLLYFETPHSDVVTCHFQDNSIEVIFKNSIAIKSPNFEETRPVLKGRLA